MARSRPERDSSSPSVKRSLVLPSQYLGFYCVSHQGKALIALPLIFFGLLHASVAPGIRLQGGVQCLRSDPLLSGNQAVAD